MENEKILTIKIDGADLVLKDIQTIKKEIDNTSKLISSMGISVDNQNSVKLFAKELGKVVDIASKTDDEIEQLSLHLKEATMNGVKLGDAIKSIPSNLKIDFGNKMIDNAIKGLQQLENETESTKRLLQALDVKDATPQQIEASRQQLKMMSLDLSKLDKQQQEAAFKRIKENKMLSESIINPNQSRTGGKAGGKSQMLNQVGFQAQDAVVMGQMGMDTSKIIAQQGSQLASAIHPLLGLGVAVGAIFGSMLSDYFEIGKAAEDAKKQNEEFKKSVSEIAEEYTKFNEDILEYIKIQDEEAVSLDVKNRTLTLLTEKYKPYIEQIQKNALEVGKVMTAEEALLQYQEEASIKRITMAKEEALLTQMYQQQLNKKIAEETKKRTQAENDAADSQRYGIAATIDAFGGLGVATMTAGLIDWFDENENDKAAATVKETTKEINNLTNQAKSLVTIKNDTKGMADMFKLSNDLIKGNAQSVYDYTYSWEGLRLVITATLKEGMAEIQALTVLIEELTKGIKDEQNKLNLEEAKGNNVLGKRVELAEKELELAKEKLKLTELEATKKGKDGKDLTKDQQAVIDAEIKYEKAKTAAREDGRKKREAAEKKEIDKQVTNLDKLQSAYDEAQAKLIEMSKTGSLEEIAQAEEDLIKAQNAYNLGLKQAVEITKNYSVESEKLNEIRAKGNLTGKVNELKNQLSELDKQLDELNKNELGVYDKIKEISELSSGDEMTFDVEVEDILNKFKETGTVTAEELKLLYELTKDTYGVLNEGDLSLFLTLDTAKKTIINKKKEIDKELSTIDVTLGGTKGDAKPVVEKNLTERFANAGKDIADAFFKGMNSASDEMIKAGTWLGMFQVYKAIEDNQKKITDKGDEMMKTVADFNTLFAKEYGDILTFDATANRIKLNQSVIDATMSKLTGDELEKFKTMLYNVQMTVAFNNREIEAMMINHNTEMQNMMLDFTDVYVKAYQTRNRYVITEQQHLIDELDYHNQDFLEQQLKTIKKEEDERKKSGKRITKNELEVIKMRRDESLRLLKNKHTEELKLEEIVGRKAIESAIKQGETQKEVIEFNKEITQEEKDRQIKAIDDATKLIIKQYDLRLVKLKDNQIKESEQQAAQFDKDVENLKNKKQEEIKAFMDIFNAANALAQILVDIVIQQQQNLVDRLQENISKIDQQIADSQAKLSELEDDLAGKQSGRRDAILRGIELEKQRERELTEQKLKQQRELEKAEKKLANQRKAAAITQAVINGALAITNIWASVPKADWGVATGILTGISAATTAAQIALIASQKFAKGGFTGNGNGQRDETGFKVAGVVHQDEWVAPKWMVESPKYGGMINELESVRQKGFADGGFTSKPDFVGMNDSMGNSFMMTQIQRSVDAAIMLSERPIVANVTEFDNVSTNKYRRMNANRL